MIIVSQDRTLMQVWWKKACIRALYTLHRINLISFLPVTLLKKAAKYLSTLLLRTLSHFYFARASSRQGNARTLRAGRLRKHASSPRGAWFYQHSAIIPLRAARRYLQAEYCAHTRRARLPLSIYFITLCPFGRPLLLPLLASFL